MDDEAEHEIANRRMRGDGRREHNRAEQLLSKVGEDWDADKGSYRALQSNYRETLTQIAHNDAKMVQRSYLWKNSRSGFGYSSHMNKHVRQGQATKDPLGGGRYKRDARLGSRRNSLRRQSRLARQIARYRTFKSRIVRVRSIP
jgi:hypothetical protein